MYSKFAIFTDLDGTLFNSRSQVSAENIEAIRTFEAAGGLFGVSTGRAPQNAAVFLRDVPINGWSVTLNGAGAYHFQKKQFLPCGALDKNDAESIVTWIQKYHPNVNIQVCTKDVMCFLTRAPYVDADFLRTHQNMQDGTLDDIREDGWLKMLLCAPKEQLEEIRRYLEQEHLLDRMDYVYSSPVYLEFLPKGSNKGSCIRRLAEMEELQGRTILTIGDFYNDIELLRQADIGVAVANAVPELKQEANVLACSNDEHALAWLIREWIPYYVKHPDLLNHKK